MEAFRGFSLFRAWDFDVWFDFAEQLFGAGACPVQAWFDAQPLKGIGMVSFNRQPVGTALPFRRG